MIDAAHPSDLVYFLDHFIRRLASAAGGDAGTIFFITGFI